MVISHTPVGVSNQKSVDVVMDMQELHAEGDMLLWNKKLQLVGIQSSAAAQGSVASLGHGQG